MKIYFKTGLKEISSLCIIESDIIIKISFEQLISNQYFYIDKTNFIREWWENGDIVTLITRPRRFGKTISKIFDEPFLIFNSSRRWPA